MVVMTAYGDVATRSRVTELAPEAFFQKPFDIDDLLATVRELGSRQRRGPWH
jgi:DNA-binding response OmpR family regulator